MYDNPESITRTAQERLFHTEGLVQDVMINRALGTDFESMDPTVELQDFATFNVKWNKERKEWVKEKVVSQRYLKNKDRLGMQRQALYYEAKDINKNISYLLNSYNKNSNTIERLQERLKAVEFLTEQFDQRYAESVISESVKNDIFNKQKVKTMLISTLRMI